MKRIKFALLSFALISAQLLISQSKLTIVDKKVSFGHSVAENRPVDVVVIHSTFNNSGGEKYDPDLVIKQFSTYGVSSHYLIGREGTIYLLVEEKDVAFHAGKSVLPNGRSGLNTCSIGIELITSFDEAPTDAQIKALAALVNDIKSRYKINFIVRHSDIAPGRKTDPWNMNWEAFLPLVTN